MSMKTRAIQVLTAALVTMFLPGTFSSALAQRQATAGQQATTAHTSSKSLPKDEVESSAPDKPGVVGITVHGHWLIDLKDKDGKVLEHRDFHNSLLISGADLLAKLISGEAVMSSMQIDAGGYIMYRPDLANHGLNSCNATPPLSPACVPSLTITYTHFDQNNNIPASTVTLSGSFVPTASTTVSVVYTNSVACYLQQQPATTALLTESPARCGALDLDAGVIYQDAFFSGTNITPLTVAPGQTLAITVVLSFS